MKETRRQIIESTRNEVAKGFNTKIKSLKEQLEQTKNDYCELHHKYIEAATERDMLKEKVTKLEDWNHRLQEFMDMSEDERKQYIAHKKIEAETSANINALMGMYSGLFNLF